MKKIALFLAACSLSFSAMAQSTEKVDSVTITAETRFNLPANGYRMGADDFAQFKGVYDLSNGQSLAMIRQGQRMFVLVDGQDKREIVATSHNSFVALDKQIKVRIDLQTSGLVSGEVYMRRTLPANAQADQTTTQWVQLALR